MTTLTTDNDKTLSRRTQQIVQQWVLHTDKTHLLVRAAQMHAVRRGLHLALKAACERIALGAEQMTTDAATDQHARRSASYADAVRFYDEIRTVLDRVGWDCWSLPEPGVPDAYALGREDRNNRAAGLPPAPRDTQISLIGASFAVLHDALTRELEDSGAQRLALLDTLNRLVDEARTAQDARAAAGAAV